MQKHGLRRGINFRLVLGFTVSFLALSSGAGLGATFDEGVTAYSSGRYDDAAAIWLPLAREGDPYAQHALGKLYENGGPGFAADPAEAAFWYQQAADQGLAAAQNNLGLLYSTGRGLPKDQVTAVGLWQSAAEQGHLHAQYNLGLAYYLGEGIALNDQQAAYWFSKAADSDLPDAQFALGQMYRMGVGLPKNEGVALGWFEKAAAQGHQEAKRRAGEMRDAGVVAVMPMPLPEAGVELAANDTTASDAIATMPLPAATPEPPKAETALVPAPETPVEEQGDGGSDLLIEASAAPPPPPPPASATITASTLPAPVPLHPVEPPTPTEDTADLAPAAEVPTSAVPVAPASAATQVATVATITPASSGDFALWLGSGKSQQEAEALAASLTSQFPELLGGVQPSIENAGERWRVLLGPFTQREDAKAACDVLRARDSAVFCKVASPG